MSEQQAVSSEKKAVGRPKQSESRQTVLKKGNSSWQPASILDVTDKEPGYRYRWSSKTADNLAKKQAEGWETVSGVQSPKTQATENNYISDGGKLTSVTEKHDCILQRLPESVAEQRDEYYNNESQRRVAGLTAHIKKDLGKEGAAAHGDITISSRHGTEVYD